MRAATPSLNKARGVEIPELYSACGNGGDALAALNAALCRHATKEEATALLIGHNPGWEEAVALLTCTPSAEGSEVPATPSAAPLRTAQAALLLSEQRSWQDALAGSWSRRGEVGPSSQEAKRTAVSGTAKRSADMTDKQLRAALKAAERAAKGEEPEKKKKKKKKKGGKREKGKKGEKDGEGSAAKAANAEPGIVGAKLDAWLDAQSGAGGQKRGKQAAAAAEGDDATAAAAKRDAKAAAKAAAAAKEEEKRAAAKLEAARRAAQKAREASKAASKAATKAAASEATRGSKLDADVSRAAAKLSQVALSGDAGKASKGGKGSEAAEKGDKRRSPGPKQRGAPKAGAKDS